ncbi:helix-turn-helix domain-containing protein [Nonomuraea rhizosphaerae]|uniref:helix-turn-helix domain-containing protein n=1 Tax=Nonomuraea rhizosphaerae TaxID=2665663 RepID=UPI001C5DF27F|nr:helix-turn-helix domain-containing protein [Nonomuraea rhizosphaerae]
MELEESDLLGQRLRELRERSGKSLRAVARELGISASAVSQIERGVMRPSVSRLIAYVGAVGVPLAAVFDAPGTEVPREPAEEPRDPAVVVRRAKEVQAVQLSGGVTFRRLSPAPTPDVEFFESTYPPNAVSTAHGQFLKHDGYEVGTVTAGELTIEFESEIVVLGEGDSITYPCARPHIIGNRSGSVTAVATWLIVHA